MDRVTVRLQSVEIRNIKNTVYGLLEMPSQIQKDISRRQGEVLGIYGQNGSGKTAVIDALFYLQKLITGEELPDDLAGCIRSGEETATLAAEFRIGGEGRQFVVGYQAKIRRISDCHVKLEREVLSASKFRGGKRGKKLVFMEYSSEEEGPVFVPRVRLEEVVSGKRDNRTNLMVAKKLAGLRGCSYIFGEVSRDVFVNQSGERFADYGFIIKSLYQYALMDLFVIRNSHSGAISASVLLPVAFCVKGNGMAAKGDLIFDLQEPTTLAQEQFDMLVKVVRDINIVLQTVVPGLTLGIQDYGRQMAADGTIGRKAELTSKRDNTEIPIRYESDGIIKIISILNVLIRAYYEPGICLAVDELDSGIYEYLLGELLDIFYKGARGQLIFTSHNLRALEMLDRDSILFSTANPKNRYIRMEQAGTNRSLRDLYLRAVTLGGQKESVYSETDSLLIARAFRKAGREMRQDG